MVDEGLGRFTTGRLALQACVYVSMCMCLCVCVHVSMCLWACVHVSMGMWLCDVSLLWYVYMCLCLYVYATVCSKGCVYAHMAMSACADVLFRRVSSRVPSANPLLRRCGSVWPYVAVCGSVWQCVAVCNRGVAVCGDMPLGPTRPPILQLVGTCGAIFEQMAVLSSVRNHNIFIGLQN